MFTFLEECSVGKTSDVEYCDGFACQWKYSSRTDLTERRCLMNIDEDIVPVLTIVSIAHLRDTLIEIDGEPTGNYERTYIVFRHAAEFICELNNCNNKQRSQTIYQTLQEHYDLWKRWRAHSISGHDTVTPKIQLIEPDETITRTSMTTTSTRLTMSITTEASTTISTNTVTELRESERATQRNKNSSTKFEFPVLLFLINFFCFYAKKLTDSV